MKVLLVNGSPHLKGCTFTALGVVADSLKEEGVETEIFQIGAQAVLDCTGCYACVEKGKCVFDDIVNPFVEKAAEFDGFVFGSPVYYAHPSGRILSFLDRAFFSGGKAFAYKPACAVVSARRAGTTASFDVLNKYFTINNMPVVSANYWNNVHGQSPEDVAEDAEGLQVMRRLGKNMAWLLKFIEAGRQNDIVPPPAEPKVRTNFIRR